MSKGTNTLDEKGILERFKMIREYRGLSQESVGVWFGISKQALGKKEAGKIAGFSLSDIQIYLERTEIDARFLFGQIDKIEDADLRIAKKISNLTELTEKIESLQNAYRAEEVREDPLSYRVKINEPLRKIVSKIAYLEGNVLHEIDIYLTGFLAGMGISARERASGE